MKNGKTRIGRVLVCLLLVSLVLFSVLPVMAEGEENAVGVERH